MALYDVYGKYAFEKYLGTVEAESVPEARKKAAELDESVSLCWSCAEDVGESFLDCLEVNVSPHE